MREETCSLDTDFEIRHKLIHLIRNLFSGNNGVDWLLFLSKSYKYEY
jgi:hypothetical protein